MTTRVRRLEEERAATLFTDNGGDNPPESGLREAGDAFLEAADAAIERALSGSPEAFLEQNRQMGGQ